MGYFILAFKLTTLGKLSIMNYQKTGRVVGLLFLMIFVVGVASLNLRGLSTSLMDSSTFLSDVHEAAPQMRWSVFLDVVAGALGIAIAIVVYPLLKSHHRSLALAYLGIWILQAVIALVGDISHLSLLSLSKDFISQGAEAPHYYTILGRTLVEDYFWSHLLSLIAFSVGAWIFYYALVTYKMIPAWLGVWGMLAVTIVFTVTWLQIFDRTVSFYFYMQNGLFMLTFITWLLIKGFKSPATMERLQSQP